MTGLSSVAEAVRRTAGLARFLGRRVERDQLEETIRLRMAGREASFLAMVRDGILANPANPVARLLDMAGIGYGDVESSLRRSGIESTLRELHRHGVYITLDEFKGRTPMERKGRRIDFHPGDLARRGPDGHFRVATGGTSGRAARVPLGYGYLEQFTVNLAMSVEVAAGLDTPLILWFPAYPSPAGLLNSLMFARVGAPPARWFAQTRKTTPSAGLTTLATLGIARLLGHRLPFPERSRIDAPGPVLDAVQDQLGRSGRCVLQTYVSSAVRLCRLASERGTDLTGLTVLCSSEPITAARREAMEASGARVVPVYWVTEVGLVGAACPDGCPDTDEVHVFQDSLALIGAGDPASSRHDGATLYFSPLLAASSTAYLNLEIGDRGRLTTAPCDCVLGRLGLTRRVAHIRSANRITLEGISLAATDLFEVVERILPRRHGGATGDYQVVEQWAEGRAELLVRVRPRPGPFDAAAIRRSFLDALAARRPLEARLLSDARAVRVVRSPPHVTEGGKILPVVIRGR